MSTPRARPIDPTTEKRKKSCRFLLRLLDWFPHSTAVARRLAHRAFPGVDYRALLSELHQVLKPGTYLEIGVHKGESLALARYSDRVVAVDSVDQRSEEPPPNLLFFEKTRDLFFETDADRALPEGVDLAFIDGLHQYEAVARDFVHILDFVMASSVIVLHDTLPLHPSICTPDRKSSFWTGDCWKLAALIKEVTQLSVTTFAVRPSGITLVQGFSSDNTELQSVIMDSVAGFKERVLDLRDESSWELFEPLVYEEASLEAVLVRGTGVAATNYFSAKTP